MSNVAVANARPQTYDTSKGEEPFTFDVSKDPYAFALDVSNDPYAYTYDVSKDPYAYAYNAEKNPYVYEYKYDNSKNPYLYDPAKDQFAGSAGSASIGELLDTLNVLTKSTLFTELLNLGDNDCQILPEPEIISEANAAVQARRGELEAAFRSLPLQQARSVPVPGRPGVYTAARSQPVAAPGATIRQLSATVGVIEPFVPVIKQLFSCDFSS